MRILYINHYAGSPFHGMEYRPHYLARHWVRAGHQVSVVAASASHVRSKAPEMSGKVKEESIDGIRYIWLRTPSYSGNGLRRAVNMASFVNRLYRMRSLLARRFSPDVVIASSTYTWDIFPASAIARLSGGKLVYEVHDLWPLSPMELGKMSALHPFVLSLQLGEDYACRRADSVVSMLPFADKHLCERGMVREKFHYIPNGIELDEWQAEAGELPLEHCAVLKECRDKGRFIVCYAGTHGLANALDGLLDAAKLLLDHPVDFVLVGQGPDKQMLQRRARELGLTNVHFLAPVPKRCIAELLRATDALFIGWKRQPLYRFGISPNKLMDYMAAGKPIINAAEVPNDCVADAGCGYSVKPEDAPALADAIARLMRLAAPERQHMGQLGKRYVHAHHDYAVLAQKFLSVMQAARMPNSLAGAPNE
ncbi:Glycosyltransferase involved in cell wall bisynthesis [Noviherbaspirillum humi]|uniref:Glycosyltransferase involved in cell wall bisynthesis n=1 Tax=Noviherbaspirillum humi TaxID=1688639 RepID=A0A239G9L3_9BURK|nr:glycosyltransferase family 4 protein [Noviherbaspirillum humi]SNS65635.1 Glycosyltransferase involved in cell wall bisynthesis [Noviherbaspirillum humi]